jgi:thimet oligopeptidase
MRFVHFLLAGVIVLFILFFVYCNYFGGHMQASMPLKDRACELDLIASLFPTTPEQIKADTERYLANVQAELAAYVALPDEKKDFEHSVCALDRIAGLSDLVLYSHALASIEHLSPDAVMRQTAHEALITIEHFMVTHISNNKPLYDAFMTYVQQVAPTEKLTAQQEYLIKEMRIGFERAGLNLPEHERAAIEVLKKELVESATTFDFNISQDASTITVDRAGLEGTAEDFIATLRRTDDGLFILGVDYPTVQVILEQCAVEDTRMRLYRAFNNRAYPVNDILLRSIIAQRDELARKLGFSTYAAFDLDNQMVHTVQRATTFLHDIYERARIKQEHELARITTTLPVSVTRTSDGLLKPWDIGFIKYTYKKEHFALDEYEIAHYFPADKTIQALFDIYQQFFGLTFKEVAVPGLWHPDVKALQVYRKQDDVLLGTLLLDLYPRSGKYSHAAHLTVIPAVRNVDGKNIPAVSIVMANFPPATETKPALLTRTAVNTFFHEFGHALHAVLGSTEFATFSGTSVKRDFVEMPSQMLEEWLWNKDILRMISSHYETGEPLPEVLLDAMIQLKQFDSGISVCTQVRYALFSLRCFSEGVDADPYAIFTDLYTRMEPAFLLDPENHFYTAFGHLTGYGAKYYGYLWSKVFALDLFGEIKKHGLLNPVIGKRYTDIVLARGGGKDPHLLLVEFLGREPRIDAFMKDLGL